MIPVSIIRNCKSDILYFNRLKPEDLVYDPSPPKVQILQSTPEVFGLMILSRSMDFLQSNFLFVVLFKRPLNAPVNETHKAEEDPNPPPTGISEFIYIIKSSLIMLVESSLLSFTKN